MNTKPKIPHFACALTCTALLFLAGCGKNAEMTDFHDNMDDFYESLAVAANNLETIDPASETAVDDMLAQLDTMDELFQTLAALEVPEEFEDQFGNIEELADEAAAYMTEADELYHEAYAADTYDDSLGQAAGENYSRAMKRVNYIAILLQGRIPEDENITVVTQEEEPDWTGGDAPSETAPAEESAPAE